MGSARLKSLALGEQSPMSSEEEGTAVPPRRLACYKCFDALWFCYSPVHQLQQYYRVGVLDNCAGKWSDLVDCLTLKTKRFAEVEEILKAREESERHIWSYRSPAEARSHWNKLFGHLEDQD